VRRPGWAARRCIGTVERYRRRGAGRGSSCRFRPSCSTFALEAFRTRAFPIALASTAWRIVRCNPLVRVGAGDPVRRAHLRPRPNALATGFTLVALAGLVLVMLSMTAYAQTLTGGCTATVNGRNPTTLTRSNPVVVQKGGTVRVKGVAPPAVQALPENQVQSNTTVTISIVEGVADVESSNHPGQGYAWGGVEEVDEYVGGPIGLYFVEATAVGTPNWTCSASGYVKLDGNPFAEPIGQAATGLTLVGGAGALISSRSKERPDASASPTAEGVKQDFGTDVDKLVGGKPKKPSIWERDLKGTALIEAGCMFFLLGPLALEGTRSAAVATSRAGGRIWVRGHPVWGAVSGLVLGIGIAVLGQQFALWPLTILTAIVFPIYAAVLGGVRAWIGTPYRRRADTVPVTTPPPPAPPPMPS